MFQNFIDRKFLLNTLSELVKIDSTNPSCTPGGAGETEIAQYISLCLSDIGLDVETYQLEPGRMNVLGLLSGEGQGRSLMFNAHMDTVGVIGMKNPFAAQVRDGKMYGRGTQDMKASLAAAITAVKALVDSNTRLPGDLFLAAVADEEYLSLGTSDLLKHCIPDAAIVTEPTNMHIALAHRGWAWLELETFGIAAHGSRYQDGVDANMRMGRVLHKLEGLEAELRQRDPHPLIGTPSLHAAIIKGGTEWSIYADHCLLQIERRTVPGESQEIILKEVQAILDDLKGEDETFEARLKLIAIRKPHEVSPEVDIVKSLLTASRSVLQREPSLVGVPFWTDAALMAAAGIDTVLMGPIGAGLHSKEEWVDLESVFQLAHILAKTAVFYNHQE